MAHRGEGSFDLDRFVAAQDANGGFDRALRELRAGRKRTHWIWFIFPQLVGLGSSAMAVRYAIGSLEEARAYLAHRVLGPRLEACAAAVAGASAASAEELLGPTDALKLRSSMTLFARVAGPRSVFAEVLERYFNGAPDERTLAGLTADAAEPSHAPSSACSAPRPTRRRTE